MPGGTLGAAILWATGLPLALVFVLTVLGVTAVGDNRRARGPERREQPH